MKRNTLTITLLILATVLTLALWLIPAQALDFLTFTNETGDTSVKNNLKLTASFIPNEHTENLMLETQLHADWNGEAFNYLLNDAYELSKVELAQMNEIYEHYSLFNRPDIKTMTPLDIENGHKIWHQSYPILHQNGTSSYKYTWLDIENGVSNTQTFDLPYPSFQVINYITQDNYVHVLLSVYQNRTNQESPTQTNLLQITLDLTDGNIVGSQETSLEHNLIALNATSDPATSDQHFIMVLTEEEWLDKTSDLSFIPSEEIEEEETYLLIDPLSLEVNEIAFEDNSSNYTDWIYANEQLYILEHIWDNTSLHYDLIIYALDQEDQSLTEKVKMEKVHHYAISDQQFMYLTEFDAQTYQLTALDLANFAETYQGDIQLEEGYQWIASALFKGYQ